MHISCIYNEGFFFSKIIEQNKEVIEDLITNKLSYYVEQLIPKKGGIRKLQCLDSESLLYDTQKKLVDNFLSHLPLPDYVCGFVKGYSYKSFLEPHLNSNTRYYIRVDIKDFFDSINQEMIKEVLTRYIKLKDKEKENNLLNLITEVVTLNGVLPQGGVTSPVISNLVFRKYDTSIANYCAKLGFEYTRYADDLLFSADDKRIHENFFIGMISRILAQKSNHGKFQINYGKIKRGINEISLNGFVVGKDIRLSRKRKNDISKIIYLYKQIPKPINVETFLSTLNDSSNEFLYRQFDEGNYFKNKNRLVNYLAGYRAFLIDWKPYDTDSYRYKKLAYTISLLEKIIVELHN